jgi:hypothetical protein
MTFHKYSWIFIYFQFRRDADEMYNYLRGRHRHHVVELDLKRVKSIHC